MKVLAQVGNLGGSIIDHLMRPLAQAENAEKVLLICHRPGPEIPKLEYHCPPKFTSRFAPAAIVYEFFTLLYLSIFKRPSRILGCRLFPHGLLSFIVAKLSRRPLFVFLIGGPAELYGIGDRRQVEFTKPLPWLGRIFLKMLKQSNAIITTGSFTKDFLIRQGVERDKIYPIINPPNDSRVHPMEVPKIYDVVSVGRLSPEKHIEVLLNAASRVRERFRDIKVCIVGDGPCRIELEKLADELGLNDNIDFVGYQKDVAYYYNSSKIFVHTSEREGFPNVFLEAMICGIPSVVSNCGDITDIARDGFNSIVVQRYNDYEGFAEAITRLLGDKEFYHKLSQNALNTTTSLSVEEVAGKWELILGKIASQSLK